MPVASARAFLHEANKNAAPASSSIGPIAGIDPTPKLDLLVGGVVKLSRARGAALPWPATRWTALSAVSGSAYSSVTMISMCAAAREPCARAHYFDFADLGSPS